MSREWEDGIVQAVNGPLASILLPCRGITEFSRVPYTNSVSVGQIVPCTRLGDPQKPLAIGSPGSIKQFRMPPSTIVIAASSWYQFHRDRTCSEIIPFAIFDTATIADEKTYWTMEA